MSQFGKIRISLVLLAVSVVIGAMGLLAYHSTASYLAASKAQASHVRDAAALAEALEILRGAETAQHGYLPSGKDTYLTPYTDRAAPGSPPRRQIDRAEPTAPGDRNPHHPQAHREKRRQTHVRKIDRPHGGPARERAGRRRVRRTALANSRQRRRGAGARANFDRAPPPVARRAFFSPREPSGKTPARLADPGSS